jgi:peroxiredoxin
MRIAIIVLVAALAVAGVLVATLRGGAPAREPQPPSATTTPKAASGHRAPNVDAALKALDLVRPVKIKSVGDFTLSTPDGKKLRLADYHGKMVFLNFWATWCEPCKEEMPAMERLWLRHKDGNFVMIGVSLDSNPKEVPPFVAQHKLTFPIVLDPKMEVANTYGVRALPTSFIVDRDGNMAALALGPRQWDNEAAHSLVEGFTR